MSSTQTRLPRAEAVTLAWEVVALLSPYCERIEVAGSIRRGRDSVGDIELVAVPRVAEPVGLDLFGNPLSSHPVNLLNMRVDWMRANGILTAREPKRWGDRYRAAMFEGFPVDLFMVLEPAQWGVIQLLRTGSAEFSKRLVTPIEKGGWMPRNLLCRDGALWTTDGHKLVTPTEESVFAFVGRPYIAPELREVS